MKTDYSTYHPSRFEWISILLQACLLVGGIAYLFYHTPLVLLPLSPLGYLYVRNSIRKRCADRQEKLIRDTGKDLSEILRLHQTERRVRVLDPDVEDG